MTRLPVRGRWFLVPVLAAAVLVGGSASNVLAVCGPFTDVTTFCSFIIELYYLGITAGTGPTTYSPNASITRGQMAVFIGALFNFVKRTENPFRVASRNNLHPFDVAYENYATVNTSAANGFCTEGGYNFVSNQGNNKIDIYYNGLGSGFVGVYTTTTANNRLACDSSFLYATSNYGTTVKRINLHTSTVQDPWVTLATAGAGDIANNGGKIAVTNNDGIVIIDKFSGAQTPVSFGTPPYGVVVDGAGNFWANTSTQLKKVSPGGSVLQTVPLDGPSTYYPVFDGANIWVPLSGTGGYDVVAINGNIVEHKANAIGGTTDMGGGVFTGQYVVFAEHGDYGCGGVGASAIVAFDVGNHNLVNYIGSNCGDGYVYTLGFDGRYVHVLAYNASDHWMF